MSNRVRRIVFLCAVSMLFGVFCYSVRNMPAWGYYRGPYGYTISNLGVFERHATDAVTTVNYDYRAFDTLGEEFILFTAVTGVMLM